MAVLHVSVYAYAARSGSSSLPIPQVPGLAEMQVPIDLKSTQSEPFPENSAFIMIVPESNCCVAFGKDPEAKDGVHPVNAGERMWYGINPGHRIAVIEYR
jgi:hypothetical protein